MAATKKVAPKPYIVKSDDNGKIKCFAISILVKEKGYGSNSPSELSARIDDILQDDYDGIYQKWAIKEVALTDEQLEEAYATV